MTVMWFSYDKKAGRDAMIAAAKAMSPAKKVARRLARKLDQRHIASDFREREDMILIDTRRRAIRVNGDGSLCHQLWDRGCDAATAARYHAVWLAHAAKLRRRAYVPAAREHIARIARGAIDAAAMYRREVE